MEMEIGWLENKSGKETLLPTIFYLFSFYLYECITCPKKKKNTVRSLKYIKQMH